MFKRTLFLSLLLISCTTLLQAQADETRNKLEMSITYNGKTVVTELLSVSPSFSRYADYNEAPAKDSAVKQTPPPEKKNPFYLSMMVRKMKPELLGILAKRTNLFTGTITVTDTYGKNPPVIIKFTGASLDTYSDQFSGNSYADSYSGASVSINCKTMNMNGIEIEP